MGIYRKYDLTHLAFRPEVPDTYYTCDAYRLQFFDGYELWYNDYVNWEDACKELRRVYTDDSYDDIISCKLYGLVFD